MKVMCNECNFESDYEQMIKHARQTGHWDEKINEIPHCHFMNDNEVIELYKKNILMTMKVNVLSSVDSFFEEIECDRKDFKHIHSDMTTDILDKYGRKRLLLEVLEGLQSTADVKRE